MSTKKAVFIAIVSMLIGAALYSISGTLYINHKKALTLDCLLSAQDREAQKACFNN